jgi:hypothetical protein
MFHEMLNTSHMSVTYWVFALSLRMTGKYQCTSK